MSDYKSTAFNNVEIRENKILKNVYLWMSLALTLTGLVSLAVVNNTNLLIAIISNRVLFFGLIIGEFALVAFLSTRIFKMSVKTAVISFTAYSILNGITLSVIFLAYTRASIANAFFVSAGTFFAVSIYGLTTKRNLSGIGHYLFMGLIGIIIASVVNFFLQLEGLRMLISYAGVAVFIGLTAYDTQKIKKWNSQLGENISESEFIRFSILGALHLYLDFINLFLFMLRILGRRK